MILPVPFLTAFSLSAQRILRGFISLAFIFPFLILGMPAFSQNAIVTENTLPGTPYADWGVTSSDQFRNTDLNGYATDISVNKGSTVHFKIDGQNGVPYTIQIFRLGYYGGNGASLKADLGSFAGYDQPAGIADAVTGLLDCGNWSESASWAVPSTAVSGIYIAKLESAAGRNHIIFIVRDDASTSKILYQANDATWQAYNAYGGNNLYNGTTSLPAGHAAKVSYNRPFFIYNAGFQTGDRGSDWYMNDAYPMLRWLERNGYDMSYTTNVDVARYGNLLLQHKIFLAQGHDEYWSKEQRDNVEAAKAAGVNLAFFTGNENYWKTRWEADANGVANRVMVCYKEGTLADGTQGEATCGYKCDVSSPIWTGLWRMGSSYDGGRPENGLTGQISWQETHGTAIEVPAAYKNYRFWRNTSVASMIPGQTTTLAPNSLGFEWDYEQFESAYPHGRITMSSTTINGFTHKLSLYKDPSGAFVFGAGTILWAWGLDDQHLGVSSAVSKDMQQATVNLFADMGVQPGTIQSDLAPATASSDVTPPVSTITSPLNGASLADNSSVTISGAATDANVVAGVEISTDGGLTWTLATGTTNWTYSWTPSGVGAFTIKTRGYDDSGNMEDGSVGSGPNVIHVVVSAATCTACHIFVNQTPSGNSVNDGQPLEVGVKFQSSVAGYVTGIRFYKSAGNVGTHIGELYAMDGTKLANATFTGETSAGWQYVTFSTPVAITANTTYVASYWSSAGNYTGTPNYFDAAVVNTPLTGLADGTDGPNGVYLYTATADFPSNSAGNKPNYWVDVTFSESLPHIVANAGPDQTIAIPVTSATLDGSASTGGITDYTWSMVSGPNTVIIADPNGVTTGVSGLVTGTYLFQLALNSGTSTAQVTVQVLPAGSSIHIFTNQTPAEPVANDGTPIQVGVKFRSSEAGYVNGIRFYKSDGNNGTHIGQLYASDGTLMGSATFNGESANGWQDVSFSTPVAITANTTYIASYWSSNGNYTGTANYFATSVVNEPLTALADGTDGPNGVYLYTPTAAFPNNSAGNKPNYWVDVDFSASLATVVANAGTDQTIVLPQSTVNLNGTASTGTITSYSWTMVSGPNTPVFATASAASTDVTGLIEGSYLFKLSLNNGISSSNVTVTVLPEGSGITIFTTQTPADPVANDGQPIELGVKFRSSEAGYVTGIRFYKSTGNTGTHIGELYAADGTKLGAATFSGETASGWQKVSFATPVPIEANTTYIASYWSGDGNYTGTANYFTNAVVNTPLTGLADGTDGPNGVFLYTASAAFPNNSAGNKPNYWVDVSFVTKLPTVVANAGTDQSVVLPVNSVTLDGMASTGTITDYSWMQISGPGAATLATPSAGTTEATGLIEGTYIFQLSVNGGISTAQTTVVVLHAGSSLTIFTTQTPSDPTSNDGQAIELGVKFRSNVAGFISGVRFYKTAGNEGAHIGQLYAADGTLLASAPFVNETATGWQNVSFASPIAINANTTYIAAYFSPDGTYTGTPNGMATAVVNNPLTGLASGTDGGNGVYLYTAAAAFPSSYAGNSPNYWVDALFTMDGGSVPVKYLTFTVTKQGRDARLDWITSMEQNNSGFEIQRSTDGITFNALHFVPGAGNSQTPKTYNFLDGNIPGPGIYYYRLLQVDYNGSSHLSKVVSIEFDSTIVILELKQNRPNPVSNSTLIGIVLPKAGKAQLMLYDQMGRPVKLLMDEVKEAGTYWITMYRNGLSSGIYYYKLQFMGESRIKKMSLF